MQVSSFTDFTDVYFELRNAKFSYFLTNKVVKSKTHLSVALSSLHLQTFSATISPRSEVFYGLTWSLHLPCEYCRSQNVGEGFGACLHSICELKRLRRKLDRFQMLPKLITSNKMTHDPAHPSRARIIHREQYEIRIRI